MKNSTFPSALVACLAIALPAHAHHSFTEFDFQHPMEIEGTLRDVMWQNPHVRFKLQSVDKNGRAVMWDIESNSVSILRRTDVKQEDLKAGNTVKVFGAPSRRSSQRFFANNVLLQNGQELVLNPDEKKPHWATAASGLKTTWTEGGTVANSNVTLFHVWASKFGDPQMISPGGMWKKDYPLTKSARKVLSAWNPVTDTVTPGCKAKGMPTIMDQPYPVEFIDKGDVILFRMEEHDTVRTIHMKGSADVEKQPKTLLGYSTGRWEGKTLVVTTSRIGWQHFDKDGVPLGAAAKFVERFTPSVDGSRLNYEITVTDPETFTEPVEMKGVWVWRPGEQVRPYNCTTSKRASLKP